MKNSRKMVLRSSSALTHKKNQSSTTFRLNCSYHLFLNLDFLSQREAKLIQETTVISFPQIGLKQRLKR